AFDGPEAQVRTICVFPAFSTVTRSSPLPVNLAMPPAEYDASRSTTQPGPSTRAISPSKIAAPAAPPAARTVHAGSGGTPRTASPMGGVSWRAPGRPYQYDVRAYDRWGVLLCEKSSIANSIDRSNGIASRMCQRVLVMYPRVSGPVQIGCAKYGYSKRSD